MKHRMQFGINMFGSKSFLALIVIVVSILTSSMLAAPVRAFQLVSCPPYGYNATSCDGPPGSIPYADAQPNTGILQASAYNVAGQGPI